jgi:hypothetical protein
MTRSCQIVLSVTHISMPNLSSLSMSMSEQRTSRRKFGTPTTFRKIGLPIKSVRLLLPFLFERRSQYPLVDLSCGRSACFIPSTILVLSGQIPTHPAGEKIAVQLVVSHHLLFISGWIQSCATEGSIRATGIGTVLEQACAD